METADENLTARVRHTLSRRFIERVVTSLGTKAIFFQSQSWNGYNCACESWHAAFWKWIDDQTPAERVARLKEWPIRPPDWSKVTAHVWSEIPCAESEKKSWLLEQTRQEVLQQWAVFSLVMRGPEAEDPDVLSMFVNDFRMAKEIGDNTYFEALARQKQRKPTKDKGDRRLKPQLLVYWIAGCLWAFTTEGIGHFLNHREPRSGNKPYDNKTIMDARRALKLYRSPRPLWWGISGTPPNLEPLT